MIAAGIKVQMCVTSPPYWGLRDYGIEPSVWADGWLGVLGLEPGYRQYIAHMVEVFELVREILADDGTLWLNMGDSYATGTAAIRTPGSRGIGSGTQAAQDIPRNGPQVGLKPKDLCMMPARVALALQEAGWWVRQDIIWHKPNPMPESIKDRCTKAHEYIFLLSKDRRYYYDADAIKEPASVETHPRGPGNKRHKGLDAYNDGATEHRTKAGLVAYANKWKQPDGWDTTKGEGGHGSIHKRGRDKGRKVAPTGSGIKNNASFDDAMAVMPETRNKRSVWTVATQPYPDAHFATFPRQLIEPCILAGSRPGDIVLDPFMGSGTTAQVAEQLGRKWIGCEMNPEYLLLQKQRLQQRSLEL